jgi:hypothetical protein
MCPYGISFTAEGSARFLFEGNASEAAHGVEHVLCIVDPGSNRRVPRPDRTMQMGRSIRNTRRDLKPDDILERKPDRGLCVFFCSFAGSAQLS